MRSSQRSRSASDSHANMVIALDFSVVDVERCSGTASQTSRPRIYAHEWKYHDAQRSRIGEELGKVFAGAQRRALPARAALPSGRAG